MGGINSGRSSGGGKRKIEGVRSIGIQQLAKACILRDGWSGEWEWKRDGKPVASIGITGGRNIITFAYTFSRGALPSENIRQPTTIIWRACRFGGEHAYFRCPGVVNGTACSRTVTRLYSAGRYLCCRHCYDLVYGSQGEDALGRAQRKGYRAQVRLKTVPSSLWDVPKRPRGMWDRTYNRHLQAILRAHTMTDETLDRATAKLVSRLGKIEPKGFW